MEITGDRRTKRTIQAVFDAFIDLMIERGYESITVQDIIDRADVGRSTFYLHFKDKDDLLQGSIGRLSSALKENSAASSACGAGGEFRFSFSHAMLRHVRSHRMLYKAMLTKKGGATVSFQMERMLCEIIEEELASEQFGNLPLPRKIIVNYVANSFMAILTWWMDSNLPCPASEADDLFHKLVLTGLYGLK